MRDVNWPQNAVDFFILKKLEEKDWKPASAVSKQVLLRRIYLDLIGLPPTLKEQERFQNDSSALALQHVVEDLLSRPAYGERWGRHWLDLVRYAETNGYERDAIKPHAWRYRDYVIDAFNSDKPYDRFVLEQLAGDELPDASTETLIATGFYRLGPWDDEPADPLADKSDHLDDLVRTTSRVFLGLTLGCSRCHNHKFDALTMLDYYRMVAIFDPLTRPRSGRTERDLPAGSRMQLATIAERDRRISELHSRIQKLKEPNAEISPKVKAEIASIEKSVEQLRHETPDLPRGYFLQEPSPKAPQTHLLLRGRPGSPGPVVEPGVPAVLVPHQPKLLAPTPYTTRRRLSLARWIADPENPLTARVIVNRVWQFHFGKGLVETSSDFGVLGAEPEHLELLNWLTHWFVHDADWSLKKLHRLILASNTYRMSKQSHPEYTQTDPENNFLWRFPYRRLEVEAIRDSMLSASGRLNRKMHGPSTYLSVPKEALDGHSDPGKIWKPLNEQEASRRTVYALIKRSMVVPMLEVLDLCDSTRSSAKRNITSVPTQALTLFNGEFVNRQSRHFADRLYQDVGGSPEKQIERAYRLALCRVPTPSELKTLKTFIQRESRQLVLEAEKENASISQAEADRLALVRLCRVIFNLNEFVYPD